MLKHALLLLFVLCGALSNAKNHPSENQELNYRIIGFSFPSIANTAKCEVEIAVGHHVSETLFIKSRFNTLPCKENKVAGEVPRFGEAYTWRVIYTLKDKTIKKSVFYHFTTGTSKNIDTNINKLSVSLPAEKYKGCFIFMDGNGVLYDMSGKPVWYVPKTIWNPDGGMSLRDLKITQQGTITVMAGEIKVIEMDYDANIVWRAPNTGEVSGEQMEYYHHEFTRLANGHYMVLGNQLLICKNKR